MCAGMNSRWSALEVHSQHISLVVPQQFGDICFEGIAAPFAIPKLTAIEPDGGVIENRIQNQSGAVFRHGRRGECEPVPGRPGDAIRRGLRNSIPIRVVEFWIEPASGIATAFRPAPLPLEFVTLGGKCSGNKYKDDDPAHETHHHPCRSSMSRNSGLWSETAGK